MTNSVDRDPNQIRDRLNAQKAWITALIADAQKKKWYGKMTIKMEKGEVCQVVKEESLLPPTVSIARRHRSR